MTERWQPTLAETIHSDMHLLGIKDDEEGFRVLIQDKAFFVYALHAHALFYRRYTHLTGLASLDAPAQTGGSAALIFLVHDSTLIASLDVFDTSTPLSHYALCFDSDDRIDIVCQGEAHVRAANST